MIDSNRPLLRIAKGRLALTLVWSIALVTLSHRAHAQTSKKPESPSGQQALLEEARDHFSRGVSSYRQGDYRTAAIEFEQAYKLSPNFRVLYNIAQTRRAVKDYARALDAFTRYLSLGDGQIPEDRRDKVRREIDALAAHVAHVSIVANVDGATVRVDDRRVGRTPLSGAVPVSAGRRKITVAKSGYKTVTHYLQAAGRQNIQVSLLLQPEPQAGTPSPPRRGPPALPRQPRAAGPSSAPRTLHPDTKGVHSGPSSGFWIGVAVTGALAAGGSVAGLIALDAKSKQEARLQTVGTSQNALDDGKVKVQRFALAADVLFGAALISGGVTAYLGLRRGQPKVGLWVSPQSVMLNAAF